MDEVAAKGWIREHVEPVGAIETAPRFEALCHELAACGVPETIQHDDLHLWNLYASDGRPRFPRLGGRLDLAPVRLVGRQLSLPRGGQRADAWRPVVHAGA